MLKRDLVGAHYHIHKPAAFRRLCVETELPGNASPKVIPAAFRRLCVETSKTDASVVRCVPSRLQAAVC